MILNITDPFNIGHVLIVMERQQIKRFSLIVGFAKTQQNYNVPVGSVSVRQAVAQTVEIIHAA